jgi:C-terminal processing protease CtpA/Prc
MLTLTLSLLMSASPDGGVITRLDLARTWEAAQLFHPSVMHREVDLDSAFITAVKALDVAKTPDDRRAAVGLVIAPLKDPSSRVLSAPTPTDAPFLTLDGGVAIMRGASAVDSAQLWGEAAVDQLLKDATHVVVDLRGTASTSPVLGLSINPSKDVDLTATQTIAHAGLDARSPSLYQSRLELAPGRHFKGNPAASKRTWAVVLGAADPVPDWAIALRESGLAVFVSPDQLGDEGALAQLTVNLGDGAVAQVRTAEYVGGGGLVATDVSVAKGQDALGVALKALAAGTKRKPRGATHALAAEPVRPFSLAPTVKTFPDREHRLLAALRLWTVARRFWAYPYVRSAQADIDVDAELLVLMTKLESANTPRAYRDTLRETAGRWIPDSHTTLFARDLMKEEVWPPFNATIVEGRSVINQVTEHAGPLKPWDVLLELNGVKLADLIAAQLPTASGSRPDGQRLRALEQALLQPAGKVKVTVEQADGKRLTTELTWSDGDAAVLFEAPTPGPHFKVLPSEFGYLDLVNLLPEEVDAAMEAVKDTKGLIIDIRGYPKGTGFQVGPRLGTNPRPAGTSTMCIPIVRANGGESDRTCESFMQQLDVWTGRRYTAPVVVLINLDAISQSEHTCLIFEAYAPVTFVGSPTRGANGNIARVDLPGNAGLVYTGMEVKHADGRQLQVVGITPDVPASPTLAGLRAGKDEVLDKAVSVLRLKTTPQRR